MKNKPPHELSSPEVAHSPFNRNASERSSIKNPEKFKAFVRFVEVSLFTAAAEQKTRAVQFEI